MKTYGIDNHLRLTIGNIAENKLFLKDKENYLKTILIQDKLNKLSLFQFFSY